MRKQLIIITIVNQNTILRIIKFVIQLKFIVKEIRNTIVR